MTMTAPPVDEAGPTDDGPTSAPDPAAALVGFLALAMVAVAAALGLAEVVAAWVAFLIVGLVLAAIAGVAGAAGRRNLEVLTPVPHHTIANIKEDIAWLRARMS